jgi:ATP-dependent HslUV protease ATP-binding subunit HslU
MSLPVEDLTPSQIVQVLDQHIVGQDAAKRAVAVALRNRYRRQRVEPASQNDIVPKNIIMMGPTGVGKTEIARRLAQMARAPFVKVEATKFTEVGYVGRDVDSIIRELVANAVRLVEAERAEEVREEANRAALERLADLLDESLPRPPLGVFGAVAATTFEDDADPDSLSVTGLQTTSEAPELSPTPAMWNDPGTGEARAARREALIDEIEAGQHDDRVVEIEFDEPNSPFVQVFTPQGMEEMGIDMLGGLGGGSRRSWRKTKVRDARAALVGNEAKRLMDEASIRREAVHRAEQTGVVFIDEIDKIAVKGGGSGPEVSREGVQRDLLPIIEGSTVPTKFGPVRTDHILFIAAGAFHMSKPSDLIPELQGRLPIRVQLDPLTQTDFRRILKEPKNALTRQYQLLLAVDGVHLEFSDDALDEIALVAAAINEKTFDIGARRLHTVLERLLEEELFNAPELISSRVTIDREFVRRRIGDLSDDPGKSNFVV